MQGRQPPPPSPLCYLVVLSEPQQIRDDEVILLKISKISHLLLYAIWKSGHLLTAHTQTFAPILWSGCCLKEFKCICF